MQPSVHFRVAGIVRPQVQCQEFPERQRRIQISGNVPKTNPNTYQKLTLGTYQKPKRIKNWVTFWISCSHARDQGAGSGGLHFGLQVGMRGCRG